MTKLEIVEEIMKKTGYEKVYIQAVVESLLLVVSDTLANGENIYLRGFGTFTLKKRKSKTVQIITKKKAMKMEAYNKPFFRPCEEFLNEIKKSDKIK
jgi:DNA-binding protein HU-beta